MRFRFGEWAPAAPVGTSLDTAPICDHLKAAHGVSLAPSDVTLKVMRHKGHCPNYGAFRLGPVADGEAFAWIVPASVAELVLPAKGASA